MNWRHSISFTVCRSSTVSERLINMALMFDIFRAADALGRFETLSLAICQDKYSANKYCTFTSMNFVVVFFWNK